ncbi:MAG: sensor histidine kinase KdpD [Chloroflexi bacterium]|nr:sensor histidine kinase KdpD [Chloroflexota bacterium]
MSTEHNRPDPEALLAVAKAEEQQHLRGKLKIFLGYAAGVGKTYTMLDAARQRQIQGTDVVIAYVETHGRAETEALLEGFEIIPRKRLEYRGTNLTEMDVDAVLVRRPALALVDELAHSNVPGSRHPKRYQDVEELLAAGIDVYTTLNVQHLESLNDVVAQITGVKVQETMPDRILDEAESLELIDLPPEELRQRLEEGKVYVPDQAARATRMFFRQGNLTALRELTMRRAARRVDDQMRAYMQARAIPGPWAATERLLVCVSLSPLSERLVRAGRRLADSLNAEWFAVYVETPDRARLSEREQDRMARTLLLAESLGARTTTLPGQSVAEAIISYAHSHNITKIIAGKPVRPRWLDIVRGSIVDQIIQQSGEIDVYIISSVPKPDHPGYTPVSGLRSPWNQYLQSILLVTGAALLGELIRPFIHPTNLVMLFLLSVLIAAVRWGRGPSIFVSILSVLIFDFFFVPPRLTFAVTDTQYLITFAGLLAVGVVISTLAARAREQADSAQRREAQTAALYALSHDLAAAVGRKAIVESIIAHVNQTFSREVAVFLPEGESLVFVSASPGFTFGQDEYAVATWAYRHGQEAGRGTDTLSAADARYHPLKTASGIMGVLAVERVNSKTLLTPEQRRLLDAFANQAALAIERAKLAEEAGHAQLLQETEKLQTALLNSISHDLRTPLSSITGSLSGLLDKDAVYDEMTRHELLKTAHEEAERLNHLVGNLLDMTRLEAGAMKITKEPYDVQDLIGAALQQVANRLGNRPVNVDLPDGLPLVPMDFVLISQVLINLLDNAIKYSPAHIPIDISVRQVNNQMQIQIADRGPGIPADDLTRVFDKFYRVQPSSKISGTGLGLSISKGIVEAHGGRIWADNRSGGGAVVTFSLPLESA